MEILLRSFSGWKYQSRGQKLSIAFGIIAYLWAMVAFFWGGISGWPYYWTNKFPLCVILGAVVLWILTTINCYAASRGKH